MRTERQTALIDAYGTVSELRKSIEKQPDRHAETAILWTAQDRLYELLAATFDGEPPAPFCARCTSAVCVCGVGR